MIGPALSAQGGVASMAGLLVQSLARGASNLPVEYLATTPVGASTSRLRKLLCAAAAYVAFLRLVQGDRSRRPSIVHVHFGIGWDIWRNLVFVVLAARRGCKVVVHVHAAWTFAGHLRAGLFGRAAIWLLRRSTAVFIAPSVGAVRELERIFRGARVEVLPNAIHVSDYDPAPLSRREQLVVYLGWLVAEKGAVDLVEAFERLHARRRDARLVMAGPYGGDLIAGEIERRGLSTVAEVVPWLPTDAKRSVLARARALALPSYAEGLPIVLLEALASGVPVVTTPVGGIPDLVSDGREGLLVAPGDVDGLAAGLEVLLTEAEVWEPMSLAARQRAGCFDAAVAVGRLETLYRSLLPGRPGGAVATAAHRVRRRV